MEVKSELVDAQFEMILDDTALAALPVKVSKVVFVISTQVTYVGTSGSPDKYVRLGGGAALGDVKHSSLDESQFAQENGNTWVLADGRDVSSSDWANLTVSNFIPDYRGVHLRSANQGGRDGSRIDSFADPDGSKSLLTTYIDKTKINGLTATSVGVGDHTHGLYYDGEQNNQWKVGGSGLRHITETVQTIPGGAHNHSISIGGGGNETTPTHGIVYTYIKINR